MPIRHAFSASTAAKSTATDIFSSHWNDVHQGSVSGSTRSLPEVLTRVFNVTSSNTSAISTLVSFSVPARTLGLDRMLRWTMLADLTKASSATGNGFTMQYLHAGSSQWVGTYSSDSAAVTTPRLLFHQVQVAALNSSGNRSLQGLSMYTSNGTVTQGLGDVSQTGAAAIRNVNVFGSSANFSITTGAAEVFAAQFNWRVANSSLSFRMRYGVLELI